MSPVAMPTAQWQNHDGGNFSDEELRGKWVLWQAAAGACDTHCRRRLCRMRQLRLMLPGNYFRLRRGWLLTDGQEPPKIITERGDCGKSGQASCKMPPKRLMSLMACFCGAEILKPCPPPAGRKIICIWPTPPAAWSCALRRKLRYTKSAPT